MFLWVEGCFSSITHSFEIAFGKRVSDWSRRATNPYRKIVACFGVSLFAINQGAFLAQESNVLPINIHHWGSLAVDPFKTSNLSYTFNISYFCDNGVLNHDETNVNKTQPLNRCFIRKCNYQSMYYCIYSIHSPNRVIGPAYIQVIRKDTPHILLHIFAC